MIKIIKSFEINTSDLVAAGENRSFTIKGDVGAKVMLQVISETSSNFPKFFNFKSNAFATMDFNKDANKLIELTGETQTVDIAFPAATDATYTILLLADPSSDTFVLNKKNKSIVKKISQITNSVVTFQAASASSSNYEAFPTTTSTGSAGSFSSNKLTLSQLIQNKDNDANGFGLRFVNNHSSTVSTITSTSADLNDTVYYFETTETVNGDTSSSKTVVVNDLTDLAVGMELTYTTGTTTPSSTTTITAIDTATKTLSLSSAQSLGNGNTMTFRAYGFKNIANAIGLLMTTKSTASALGKVVTKTVRSNVSSSTTITLNGTRDVSGGNFVTYTGLGVDNSSTNTVTTNRTDGSTATASASAGEIIVTNAQTLTAGTVLTFDGCVGGFTFTHTLSIAQYPSTNRTINIDVDRFITVGVQNA
tara:strand:+ start:294 stop:1556 length:1263 start_codon:yes stop_codon:yes gene_type:complete